MFFTNFWKKKVVEHDDKLKSNIQARVEFGTGLIIAEDAAKSVELRRFNFRSGWSGHSFRNEPEYHIERAWFREEKKPDCDYIIQDEDGKVTYHKKQADLDVTSVVTGQKKVEEKAVSLLKEIDQTQKAKRKYVRRGVGNQ